MTEQWKRLMPAVLSVAMILAAAAPAHHLALRFNLEEMTATADRIFLGRCTAVEEADEFIAGGEMAVTRYTFEVERAIKGRVPAVVTIRQLGHAPGRVKGRSGDSTMGGKPVTRKSALHGASDYRVGDRVVLFLVKEYMGGKITRPVGSSQGAFYVRRMPSGAEVVRNSINNLGLFTAPYNGAGMKADAARVIFPDRNQPLVDIPGIKLQSDTVVRSRGALPLDGFIELVDQIIAAHRGETGVITQ